MFNNGHYELSHKITKQIQAFLGSSLNGKGEELEAAIDIIAHLFRSPQGCKLVMLDIQSLEGYVRLSRSTQDGVKRPFYDSLVSLTEHACVTSKATKEHPKYKIVINLLNCIGKPNLTG